MQCWRVEAKRLAHARKQAWHAARPTNATSGLGTAQQTDMLTVLNKRVSRSFSIPNKLTKNLADSYTKQRLPPCSLKKQFIQLQSPRTNHSQVHPPFYRRSGVRLFNPIQLHHHLCGMTFDNVQRSCELKGPRGARRMCSHSRGSLGTSKQHRHNVSTGVC